MPKSRYTLADIQSAHFSRKPPDFARTRARQSGRKAEGIRYEKKVLAELSARSEWFLPSPWIIFIVDGRPCWCQPDGLLFDVGAGLVTIIECKYSHCLEAHRQLRDVYEPVIRTMFPRPFWGVRLVEVVKWFDPDTKFPEPVTMISDPFAHAGQGIGVHVLKP